MVAATVGSFGDRRQQSQDYQLPQDSHIVKKKAKKAQMPGGLGGGGREASQEGTPIHYSPHHAGDGVSQISQKRGSTRGSPKEVLLNSDDSPRSSTTMPGDGEDVPSSRDRLRNDGELVLQMLERKYKLRGHGQDGLPIRARLGEEGTFGVQGPKVEKRKKKVLPMAVQGDVDIDRDRLGRCGDSILKMIEKKQATKDKSGKKIRNRPCIPMYDIAQRKLRFWFFPDSGEIHEVRL
eukprot:TRINITY_DN102115_c0_g1_i1.p1 TRINITY_DN102115_c0_g1~~TRINITY_DN102115_c0_g1_i1.p1  ORF type:complete len:236 (-),score=58.67 TRINITY_DN102115_c0_g1_i1:113-820(-)